jgi:hypothetical protein
MNKAKFCYALEPILLARRWALDGLLRTLAEHNKQVLAAEAEELLLHARLEAATTEWMSVSAAGQARPVQCFAMNVAYLSDLTGQLRDHAARREKLLAAREHIVDMLVSAHRAVEAAEDHRGAMKAAFLRKRLSADFNVADDQWNTLQTGAGRDGH